MMILEKLRQLNENKIVLNEDDKKELKRQKEIQKMLEDDKCFFKMNIEQSYNVLRDLGIEEGALRAIYLELINATPKEEDESKND